MAGMIQYINQFRVQGPDGSVIYLGAGQFSNPLEVFNNDTAAVNAGEAVRVDSTNAVIPRIVKYAAGVSPDTDIPQTEALKVLRVSAAANVAFVGVAQAAIPVNGTNWVAGSGSVVGVTCLASPTSTTLGAQVIGSATAGSVDMVGPNAAGSATSAPAGGTVLGRLVKAPGTSLPSQTGSTTVAGVYISPQ